jgi:hypothetical protein
MQNIARARRWERLLERFPDFQNYHVLDLGGTTNTWLQEAPVQPKHVTIVNTYPLVDPGLHWMTVTMGDATTMRYWGDRVDFVYCNSVIEHVGGHERRVGLAETVVKLAPEFWVQTPYRYFPLEPHWRFPGMQFLPTNARAAISRNWIGNPGYRGKTKGESIEDVLSIELLTKTEMRWYFPTADVKITGKSLIAARGGEA